MTRDEAIAAIKISRYTHQEWIAYLHNHPEEAKQPTPQVEIAGDIDHHLACIKRYDEVIDFLKTCREVASG